MRKVAGLVVLLGFVGAVGAQDEVTALLKKLKSPDEANRREAALELGELAKNGKLGASASRVARELGDRIVLSGEKDAVKANAIGALAKIGPDGRDAIGSLLRVVVNDKAQRNAAADALVKMGRHSIVGLCKFADDRNQPKEVRIACAKSLKAIPAAEYAGLEELKETDEKAKTEKLVGPKYVELAILQLRSALVNDAEKEVRRDAAGALGRFGPKAKAAVGDLIKALDDKEAIVKEGAIGALGSMGPEAAKAAKVLREIMLTQPKLAPQAMAALSRMGQDGLAVITPLITSTDAAQRRQAFTIITGATPLDPIFLPHVVNGLKDPDAAIRKLCTGAVGKLGADPKILPDLLQVQATDPKINKDLQAIVRKLIDQIGKAGIPLYIELVQKHKEPIVRQRSADELGGFGKEVAKEAGPVLEGVVFKDPNEQVRRSAASALEKMGVSVVSLIAKKLSSPDAADRAFAMATLADLGEKAEPALKEITAAMKNDPDPKVRRNALFVLKAIGKKALPHVPVALSDKEADIRAEAIQVLVGLGADDPKTLPLLAKGLEDADPSVRASAADAISVLGPAAAKDEEAAKKLTIALTQALKDKHDPVRKNAALALGKMGQVAVAPLTDALRNKDKEVRYVAILALQDLRDKAASAAPALAYCVREKEEPYEKVRQVAAVILRELRRDLPKQQVNPPMSKDAIPALAEALKDSDRDVRENAALALTSFGRDEGAKDKVVIANLFECLRDKEDGVRSNAADALANIGLPAVDVLINGLRNKEKDVRRLSAEALGKIGKNAKSAVPALQAVTEDKEAEVRDAAKLALTRIGK